MTLITGFGASGPSGIHSSLESGFPSHHFKAAGEEYPAGYYKEGNGYAKREAPLYYIVENDNSDKVFDYISFSVCGLMFITWGSFSDSQCQ